MGAGHLARRAVRISIVVAATPALDVVTPSTATAVLVAAKLSPPLLALATAALVTSRA